MDWIEVDKRLPNGSSLDEVQVIAYKKDWICPDSNPLGQRMCWFDGDRWNCARFSAYKEVYIDEEVNNENNPTHWKSLSKSPE